SWPPPRSGGEFQRMGPCTQMSRGLSGAISSASLTSGKIWPTNFFRARLLFPVHKSQKTQTRDCANFGIDERRILFHRDFEFHERGVEILLQVFWINRVIEAVNPPPPLRKAAPVSNARREFLVFYE